MLAGSVATMWVLLAQQWHDGPYRVSSVSHRMPELDYELFWAAGKMAEAGRAAQLYDGPGFLAWREQLFGAGLFRLDWIYPPPMIAVAMAFCRMPLLAGYVVWGVLVCGASVWVLRGAGLSWRVVLFGLFGPPAWRGITSGQYAPLAASLVVAGLLQARRAPLRAGLLIVLATLKPHLGILVPVVWLAQRRWTAFATATAGTLVLAAGSTALFGAAIWPAFLHGSSASARALLERASPEGYAGGAASVFWMVRSLGATIAFGYAAQLLAALLAVALVWLAARRGGDTAAAGVAVCLTLLVSPYLYYSDMVGYSIVVAMLAERHPAAVLPIFLWLFPGISESLAVLTGVQVLPLFAGLAAALAWREFAAELPRREDMGA